ncbi:hypothetical protein D3C80_1787270 [compost metagenome]
MNFSTVSAMAGERLPMVTRAVVAAPSANLFIVLFMVSSSKEPIQIRSSILIAASDGFTPSPGPDGR